MSRIALAVVLSLFVPAPVAAQLPSDPSQVPVYPGATRPSEEDAEEEADLDFRTHWMESTDDPIEVLEQGRRIWVVEAAAEDVYAWYLARLAVREQSGDDMWEAMEEGGELEPFVEVSRWDTERPGDDMLLSGPEIRRRLQASGRRTIASSAHAEPVFLQSATFGWAAPRGDGETIEFSLDLVDWGELGERPHQTKIDLQWSRYLAGDEAGEYRERAEDEHDERVYRERMAEMGSAPTEEQMGVTPYAGARYQRDLSVGMSSSEDERYYVFFTDDDPAAVRTFYESATGRTANEIAGGTFVVAIEGRGIMPDHGVMISPTAGTPYASSGRTLITIRRVIATDDDGDDW